VATACQGRSSEHVCSCSSGLARTVTNHNMRAPSWLACMCISVLQPTGLTRQAKFFHLELNGAPNLAFYTKRRLTAPRQEWFNV